MLEFFKQKFGSLKSESQLDLVKLRFFFFLSVFRTKERLEPNLSCVKRRVRNDHLIRVRLSNKSENEADNESDNKSNNKISDH